MADCEVEGTIASPLSIPLERAMSPTGERRDEGGNIRTKENPLGPQERQTRISKAEARYAELHLSTINKSQGVSLIKDNLIAQAPFTSYDMGWRLREPYAQRQSGITKIYSKSVWNGVQNTLF
ncbi:hypothetical protein TNCV_2186451 [Trichonephila clavipes]|nr:hypothetical protein TNCV_2186451 [Trichonephila clavipes]